MAVKVILKDHAETHLPKIASFFQLGEIVSVHYLEEALANHNWKISTDKGKEFVIKILAGQTKEGIKNHLAICEQLQRTGINTANWIQSPLGSIFYEDGTIVAVTSPVIAGKYPNEIDVKLLCEIGKVIGLFHTYVTHLPYQQTSWLNINCSSDQLAENKQIERARKLIDFSKDIFTMNLPVGIIHGDVFKTNLFVDDHDQYKIVALFDFETAEQNVLILDLARTILENCKTADKPYIDQHKVDSLLKGYDIIRQLTHAELSVLKKTILYVAGITTFWFIKNGYERISLGYLDCAEKYYE